MSYQIASTIMPGMTLHRITGNRKPSGTHHTCNHRKRCPILTRSIKLSPINLGQVFAQSADGTFGPIALGAFSERIGK
jgi:hypothetical protein